MAAGLFKPKEIDILTTNIANLGSDLEKNVRATAANSEKEWKTAGKEEGLQIWRIEKFKVKPWPKNEYGHFYQGDSYIVLKTKKVNDALAWDVHFWLGLDTTQDEAGTAAYKTVELDDYLGTAPIQHREVQGFESKLFLSYFPNNAITILAGGIDSGFNHVSPDQYRPRLLHVKGKKKSHRVTEVPLEVASLNSGDIFILDLGLNLYQMNGKNSTGTERNKAAQLARAIDDERGGKATVHVAEQGDGDKDFWGAFWAAFGGEGEISDNSGDDEAAAVEGQKTRKLLRLKDAEGDNLSFEVVGEGKITRDLLDTNDVFVLDQGQEVFVWIGKGSSANERKGCMVYAQQYLSQFNRPLALPITRIFEGGENEVFETTFK